MNKSFILLWMIFMHIVDDYRLQGILASMKQKSWWKEQPQYKPMYKRDYIAALLTHSFSWAFMIMLPIMFMNRFCVTSTMIVALVINMIVHCVVDDLKANKMKINLVQDQTIHILQIVVTFLIFA